MNISKAELKASILEAASISSIVCVFCFIGHYIVAIASI